MLESKLPTTSLHTPGGEQAADIEPGEPHSCTSEEQHDISCSPTNPARPEYFGLNRFPEFIAAVLNRLEEIMNAREVAVMHAAEQCLEAFYCKLSPYMHVHGGMCADDDLHVRLAVKTDGHDQLALNIFRCFMEDDVSKVQSDLLSELDVIAAAVGESGWTENCVEERRQIAARMQKIRTAREG
jgi:hypothetical protein